MKSFRFKVILPLIAFTAVVWIYRGSIQNQILMRGTLGNDAPTQQAVSDMIEHAADPHAALLAAWNSGGIIHREVAISELPKIFPAGKPLPPDVNSLLLSAALDPDVNVRELAFGILRERQHPAWLALAAAQLHDVDQSVRLLGLYQFKSVTSPAAVPLVASLLDDPDIAVAGLSVKFLERFSGQTFGVKLSDTVQVADETTGLPEFQAEGVARTRAAAEQAKTWWSLHRGEFPAVKLDVPAAAYTARLTVPAGDFQLRTLDGKKVSLLDYRGKVVLINFWTTWCTACIGEMPELIALQKQHADKVVILGVSLDFDSDDDGDVGGDEAASKPDANGQKPPPATEEQIRAKVARTVSLRGLNYPVLLDHNNSVGARFNGGELPTTVIVDVQGNIRRRFVGARSLAVFSAMISEASRNPAVAQVSDLNEPALSAVVK